MAKSKFFYFSVIFLTLLFFQLTLYREFVFDPDRFFHLMLSQMTAKFGLIRVLPQADDLMWSRLFIDKNFLFHQIGALLWHLGKDDGLYLFIRLLFFSIPMLLFYHFSQNKNFSAWHFFFFFIIFISSTPFMYRLSLLRPHSLMYLEFILFLIFFNQKSKWSMPFLICFVLTTQLLFIPLIFMFMHFLFDPQRSQHYKYYSLNLAALLIGILIHPYFPGNITIGLTSLKIALNTLNLNSLYRPVEVLGATPTVVLKEFFWPSLVLFFSVCYYSTQVFRKKSLDPFLSNFPQNSFFILFLVFTLLALKSARAISYAYISCFFFIKAIPFEHLNRTKKLSLSIVASGTLFYLVFLPNNFKTAYNKYYNRSESKAYFDQLNYIKYKAFAIYDAIKDLPTRTKVYNCDWPEGSLIFYYRNDIKFVDFNDPYLLFNESPHLGELKLSLASGRVPKANRIIKDVFKADTIICLRPQFNEQMKTFDDLAQIYPGQKNSESPVMVFKFKDSKVH